MCLLADGWTWVDYGEIDFPKIVGNLEDLAFSMDDVVEFETNHAPGIQLETKKESITDNRFERNGDVWNIFYDGKTTSINHTKGVDEIAYLLAHKFTSIKAVVSF